MTGIKVFVVDDHPMVVEGLTSMLSREPSIELMGHAGNAASCLGYFVQHTADVVLVDINLPGKNGMELCQELKAKYPQVKVLAISSFNQGSYVKQMMELGASGYVFKNALKEELLEAIHEVMNGRIYLSHEASYAMREEKKRSESLPRLTKREKEVIQCIADGLTNPQIADKLFVSQSTIESHRKSLMSKLNASNTASLLKAGSEFGFLKK